MDDGGDAGGGSEGPAVSRRTLLTVAVAGEGVLALAGLVVIRLSRGRLDVPWAVSVQSLAWGFAAAFVLAALLVWMLNRAPDSWPFRQLRRLSRDVLRPIFAAAGPIDILAISAAAGLGEEFLFRGALQPLVGLWPASVLFGLCHLAGRDTIPLALWAAGAGVIFGLLMRHTGGLAAPVTAHLAYDALALAYLRRTACPPWPEGRRRKD